MRVVILASAMRGQTHLMDTLPLRFVGVPRAGSGCAASRSAAACAKLLRELPSEADLHAEQDASHSDILVM